MPQINVRLKNRSYPIVIGQNIDRKMMHLVKSHSRSGRLFVFFDATVYSLYGPALEKIFRSARLEFESFVIPSGEKYKSEKTVEKLYDFLLDKKITRSDFILAVGGGVCSDITGYAAATILRGVNWGVITTTLLGMVDAAIGGKTGINHPRGKNLIGAFWQPSFVFCDLKYLNTLPERELFAGLGEILKYAGLVGGKSITQLETYITKNKLLDIKRLLQFVKTGAKYKAIIVMADEREKNRRMFLNLGHTFAHAIEKTLGYGKLLHGEAVIIGLNAAAILSQKENPGAVSDFERYHKLARTFLKFVRYLPIRADKVLKNMELDKKRSGDKQKFVLLKRPGNPFIATGQKDRTIRESLEECLIDYQKAHQ